MADNDGHGGEVREFRERLRRHQEGAGCTSAHHRRPLRFNHPGTPGPSPPPTTIHLHHPQGVDGTRNDALFASEIALRGATSQPLPNGRAPARTAGRGQRDEGGVVGRATRAPSPPATTPTASALPKMTTPAPPSTAKSPPRRATSPSDRKAEWGVGVPGPPPPLPRRPLHLRPPN